MGWSTRAVALGLGALAAVLVIMPAATAPAAQRYCPDAAHAQPAPVPATLVAAVARAFQADRAAVRDAAFVRCVGDRLMGCYVGANLICDKADTRRALPGATAWCREHPDSMIPMAATGHATIYDWACRGTNAVAGRVLQAVDPDGYIADNWKQIR
ncbi:MAG: hypothetical protein P4M07_09995 [Xanthobacteraceae bacterium]|nr:hypothetical protein [Xanthobacteraceae bacterium]